MNTITLIGNLTAKPTTATFGYCKMLVLKVATQAPRGSAVPLRFIQVRYDYGRIITRETLDRLDTGSLVVVHGTLEEEFGEQYILAERVGKAL